ncbi:unnamed protein product [Kuraishia capsulata CBS 1993]|uniref:GPI mannosyltransferase 2 n=1 Tax=Kuraishia capsulata CBS 1993 TaxID=1382522 RepID=W6MS99_9ASCO|nr:uncharacterized protein KUCA_T00004063001 [Kuraishia capsulata CBS 1993]CDK28082.1 unnamed protein product [Kuraishia capsulata CBS 1993]
MKFAVKLVTIFVLIKSIEVVVLSQVATQFDTSTALHLEKTPAILSDKHEFVLDLQHFRLNKLLITYITNTVERLVSWDAVYFVDFFKSGTVDYEQHWVFGPAWWRLVHVVGTRLTSNYYWVIIIGFLITGICHFGTSVMVYFLTKSIFQDEQMGQRAALLSVLSPAGVFLTSPYSESLCSFLTMCGLFLHEQSFDRATLTVKSKVFYLFSGVLFGISLTVRSNALLLGAIFAYDFAILAYSKLFLLSLVPLASGALTGSFFVWLNYLPYKELCPERGEWCDSAIPSLMLYAQAHHWNNGFLKYWTPNNIPNFLFALPTIYLFSASLWEFRSEKRIQSTVIVSLLFLVLNVTSWNVQIITRISSFLPIGYWYLAQEHKQVSRTRWVTWSVIWIIVQTGLFGMFLPPA